MGIQVTGDIPEALASDLFGKAVTDLQENIVVSDNTIAGTLKHVAGYTGFSGNVEEQTGNYIALHCNVPGAPNATITVQHTKDPVKLDSDKVIVIKVTAGRTIKVTAKAKGLGTVQKEFSLTGLTLNDS